MWLGPRTRPGIALQRFAGPRRGLEHPGRWSSLWCQGSYAAGEPHNICNVSPWGLLSLNPRSRSHPEKELSQLSTASSCKTCTTSWRIFEDLMRKLCEIGYALLQGLLHIMLHLAPQFSRAEGSGSNSALSGSGPVRSHRCANCAGACLI